MITEAVLHGLPRTQLIIDEEVVGHLTALHVAVHVHTVIIEVENKVEVESLVRDVGLETECVDYDLYLSL